MATALSFISSNHLFRWLMIFKRPAQTADGLSTHATNSEVFGD